MYVGIPGRRVELSDVPVPRVYTVMTPTESFDLQNVNSGQGCASIRDAGEQPDFRAEVN